MYPLIVSISLLFNWNTEEEKQVRQKSEKEFIEVIENEKRNLELTR